MKRFLILLLAGLVCMTACQKASPTPSSTSTNLTDSLPISTTSSEDSAQPDEPIDFSALFSPKSRNEGATVTPMTPDGSYITGNYTKVDSKQTLLPAY